MYSTETLNRQTVGTLDALATGLNVADIVSRTQRRRRLAMGRRGTPRPTANDKSNGGTRPSKESKIELVLYISPASEKCQKAIRTVRDVLEHYDMAQVKFSVRDLAQRAEEADEDAVVFTPTLVKRGPGPRTWIVGSLDAPDLLIDLLEVSGVDRRR